jgi:hypothetical protein
LPPQNRAPGERSLLAGVVTPEWSPKGATTKLLSSKPPITLMDGILYQQHIYNQHLTDKTPVTPMDRYLYLQPLCNQQHSHHNPVTPIDRYLYQ